MKVSFLIFTILFSTSVLADCCNFEVETSVDECSFVQMDSDHCGESSDHKGEQHCHCSPINHFKIMGQNKVQITGPLSFPSELNSHPHLLLISHYESLIFHPPIA